VEWGIRLEQPSVVAPCRSGDASGVLSKPAQVRPPPEQIALAIQTEVTMMSL
jgi:hypothetical protein